MSNMLEQVEAAARAVRARAALVPRIGIILGSGLGEVAASAAVEARLSTSELPGFPCSTVTGHAGALLLGTLEGKAVAILAGRVHGYEGYAPDRLGFGVRVLAQLGCQVLIVTNAAGGLNPSFAPADVMLIEDHISFPSLAGASPLTGFPAGLALRRFVDLTDAYDPVLRRLAREAASRSSVSLRQGVYVMVGGPNFETPAEVRFLRQIGGDAVGMSTVPEVIVARQVGLRVLGLSAISNLAAGLPGALLAHEDVLAKMRQAEPAVTRIIRGVVAGLPA